MPKAFESRDFKVITGFHPEMTEEHNPGEIDLICIRDKSVIVIEVKSSYLRSTGHEVWQYKTRTLRKAGMQVDRKLKAVRFLLAADPQLFADRGLPVIDDSYDFHGWIVDTCGELDHELFSGYLKVTVDEILIALRDEAHRLHSIEGISLNGVPEGQTTLYPDGFSSEIFIEAIESGLVWKDYD